MQQAPSNSSQMRTAAIVTIVVIIGLLLLGRFVTGMMDNNTNDTTTTNTTTTTNGNGDLVPPSSNTNNTTLDTSGLGLVVAAQSVDRDNCAVNTTSTFDTNDAVYIVMEDARLEQGTTMFARLYRNGVAVEDTRELTAEDDYDNVCVSFVFEPSASAEVWDAGQYEAEFFVNGNSYRSTSFDIR